MQTYPNQTITLKIIKLAYGRTSSYGGRTPNIETVEHNRQRFKYQLRFETIFNSMLLFFYNLFSNMNNQCLIIF